MFELFPLFQDDAIRKTTLSVARDIGKGFVLIKRGEFEWSRAERFIRSFGDFRRLLRFTLKQAFLTCVATRVCRDA